MSDSSIRLGVNGQPCCDFLVARVLWPDSGNVRSDQQNHGCLASQSGIAVFGLFLQPRWAPEEKAGAAQLLGKEMKYES